MSSHSSHPALEIQIAPHESAVDYLKTRPVPVGVRNHSDEQIILEDVSLTFQTDYPIPPENVTVKLPCDGCKVAPKALEYFHVPVIPSLLYRPATNYFSVVVAYRRVKGKTLSALAQAESAHASYLVVKEPPIFPPAQVFVSFKDSEDLELASLAARFLRRGGLEPYLARNDPRPGSDYWRDKIEPAVRSSVALTVVWSRQTTGHDESVVREVHIARGAGVPDVLLLEQSVAAPREYPPADLEHAKFDRTAPWIPFAQAIEVVARRIRAGKGL
jgi:hypothetical protein